MKLRARLVEHYITAGAADLVVIGLPKDDNKPVFRPALSNGIAGSEQCLMPMLVEHQTAGLVDKLTSICYRSDEARQRYRVTVRP